MKKPLVYIILLFVLWALFFKSEPAVELGPGVKAAEEPVQIDIEAPSFSFSEFTIKPQAEFDLEGKILSKKYYTDAEESLTFVDLAMGWGKMSDEDILKDIEITQSGRWYHWKVESLPIPRREIETHSANMHIIASDESIREIIEDTPAGSIVHFKGYLVRAEKPGGWFWQSSLTRDDTGGGSCELVYVKDFYRVE